MLDIKDIDTSYTIHSYQTRKYDKFLVTIALRLGIEVKEPDDIKLNFKGGFSEHNKKTFTKDGKSFSHDSYNFLGTLSVNGEPYTETEVKICTPREDQSQIRTLWPVFKDSNRSQLTNHTKTRDFIDEYGSDRINLTISDLANYYHELFLDDPERTPLSMSEEVAEKKAAIRRKMHKDEKEKLKAEHSEEIKKIEARLKKELSDQKKDFETHLELANKENIINQGSPSEKTKRSNPDVDWGSSSITSAVFNYYEVNGDYLCIYINNQTKPIRLKNTSWKSKYPAALINVQKLSKGDIFKYITQGTNRFSSEEWFNRIIIEVQKSNKLEVSEDLEFLEAFDVIKDINVTAVNEYKGASYILNEQIISDLNNTKYTFNTSFNVTNTYIIPGEEFRKHFGFPWSRPMILIETDIGWYIDSLSNSNGEAKWTNGMHENCRVSLTKGKHLPYWLEK